MKQLAERVWRLNEFPRPTINVYLAGDVLIDAGRRWDRRRILGQLQGRELSLVALTHVHPDHQGVAKDVCEEAGASNLVNRLIQKFWEGPPHQVGRVLAEGDEVAGFRVVHAPGHARGEVIYFRDADGVAICGDVIRNMSYATTLPGLREPPEIFTYDPAENRRSIRKLAGLGPKLILPGHGPAITEMADFERFVAALPCD